MYSPDALAAFTVYMVISIALIWAISQAFLLISKKMLNRELSQTRLYPETHTTVSLTAPPECACGELPHEGTMWLMPSIDKGRTVWRGRRS